MSGSNGGNGGPLPRSFMSQVKLDELNSTLVGLILSIWDMDERITDAGMTGTQVKEAFVDMFPPSVLFSPDIRTMSAVYSNRRD